MSKSRRPQSPTQRLRRSLRRSLGSGGGGRALGVLAAIAIATAGIVLSTGGTSGAAPVPPPTTTTTTTTNPNVPGSAALQFANGPLTGQAALAQSGIVVGSPQQVLVDLELNATGQATTDRVPVAMTLVLDRSGSMSGQKIEQARRSVLQALEQMRDGDYFGFVVYDHSAQILVPLQPVGPNRQSIRRSIQSVRSGGGTQIPQGLDLGYQTLQSAPTGYARRMVLVSDGIDGSGVGPQGVRRTVAGYGQSGVTVAALGIGTDYEEAFLTAVADAGNGAYAYLATGSELQGFLAQEMRAASQMVAERIAFQVMLPPNTHFRRAHGATGTAVPGGVQLQVGNMASGDERHIVLELESTAMTTGPMGDISLSVDFNDRTADRLANAHVGAMKLSGVSDESIAAQTRNPEAYAAAKAVVIEVAQAEAMDRWRAGDTEGAVRMARSNAAALQGLQQYAPDDPAVAEAADEAEEDAESFQVLAPSSAAGRGYGLSSNARRRSRSTGL